mgnify:CR=1 FL=1
MKNPLKNIGNLFKKLKTQFEFSAINTIGVGAAVLVVIFFIVAIIKTAPKSEQLISFPPVVLPQAYSEVLDNELKDLKKIADTPVVVDPADVGKENPYL